MRRGKVGELEERLKEIRNRRGLLESAFAEKQALLNQLESARGESMKRLIASIEDQNQRARERNYQFLEDILIASHQPNSFSASFSSDPSNDNKKRLADAKKHFVKMMENALPALHRSESIRLEEKMRALTVEKMQSQQRREKLRHELAHEEQVKMELEHQRRELVQSLALEQRDLMEAEASSAYLAAEGKLADEQIKENVNLYGQQLEYILQDRLRNYSTRESIPKLVPNSGLIPHDYVRPRVVDHHPANAVFASDEPLETEEIEEHPMISKEALRMIPTKATKLSEAKSNVVEYKSEVTDDKTNAVPEYKRYDSDTSIAQTKEYEIVQSFSESKTNISQLPEATSAKSGAATSSSFLAAEAKQSSTTAAAQGKIHDEDSEFDVSLDGSVASQPITNTIAQPQPDISTSTTTTERPKVPQPQPKKEHLVIQDHELPSLEDLDLGRCQSICNQLFSNIVNKVTFDTKVSSIYQEYRSIEDVRAVRFHLKDILDDDSRQISPRNDKLQGDIVLALLAAKGELLMPMDAFAGVVTMDKLRKELKKSHVPGVLQYWDAVIKHLQSIVEVDENSVEFLARCFTSALIDHVKPDDKDRMQRKMFTLLKVAIIPEEKDESFADSPYRRSNPNAPVNSSFVEPFVPKLFESKPAKITIEAPKKVPEFDDDEFISEDSVLEKPPQIKDLDATNNNKTAAQSTKQSHSDDVDEFDF